MADIPRYLGTTTAAALAAFQEIVGGASKALRYFDIDGNGTIASGSADETAFARAVAAAETQVDEILGASHGAPWTAEEFAALPAGTQSSIKQCVARMAPWEHVQFNLVGTEDEKGVEKMHARALKRLEGISEDNRRRLPDVGAPAPTAAGGVIDVDLDTPTLVGLDWLRNASSGSGSY